MKNGTETGIGAIIKRQRLLRSLTLRELSATSQVSSSHLGRVERGERFPSARVLRRIALPLGLEEEELFALAGYLSPHTGAAEPQAGYTGGQLDPYVARVLSQEPVETQRAVLSILAILKSLARNINEPQNGK
ncbi:MAG: helix-turn-helix transcriptional regulator [Chloroflexota bacterium]